jgi:hypothetical protein
MGIFDNIVSALKGVVGQVAATEGPALISAALAKDRV